MPTLVQASSFDVPPEFLFGWHLREGAFERLSPPWDPVRVVERTGDVAAGRLVLELRPFPCVRLRWVAQHQDFIEGTQFRDVQESGPFKSWVHTHRFEGPRLLDEVEYELGFPASLVAGMVKKRLETLFRWRHERMRRDLARHVRYQHEDRLTVAITGASGLVGTALSAFLSTGGHRVLRLTRSRPVADGEAYWNPASGEIDADALEGVDAVVNLAGAPIAQRWTDSAKRAILRSRVDGTRLLSQALAELKRPPGVLISASAIGIYGDRGDEILDEDSVDAREGFLEDVCRAWEAAADPARDAGIRVCHPRIGVVLSPLGGALSAMLPAFRLGVGGPVGSGNQWMPWIDLDDLVAIFHFLMLEPSCSGPYNAVSPHPVRNGEFATALGLTLARPALLPTPAFAVRLGLGEAARLALDSARVVPRNIERAGFLFDNERVHDALSWQLGTWGP